MIYRIHRLKTWPVFFNRVYSGQKRFEVHRNDRDFQTGDILRLQEFDPDKQAFTDRTYDVVIDYILHGGQFGIQKGFCVMGISPSYRSIEEEE